MAVTASPFEIVTSALRSSFQVENSCTWSVAVHAPNWHPSNGQAFSSIFGSVGLGALCGVSEESSCGAANNISRAMILSMLQGTSTAQHSATPRARFRSELFTILDIQI